MRWASFQCVISRSDLSFVCRYTGMIPLHRRYIDILRTLHDLDNFWGNLFNKRIER